MAAQVKQFAQAALDSNLQVLYTAPLDKAAILKTVSLAVHDLDYPEYEFKVLIVPAGGVAGIDNLFLQSIEVPAHGFYEWSGLHAIPPGGTLQASGPGMTITVSGAEQ